MARDLVLEVIEQVRGNALASAARDLDKVAGSTDDAAGSARDYTGDLKKLDAQISSTQLRIRALGAEFVSTGDKATGKDLRGERSLLGQLEKIRKELEQATPGLAEAAGAAGQAAGGNAGQGFISSFFDTLSDIPGRLRGAALVGVAGVAVAAAPAIGASVAGAVLGGVGAGGIIGGVAAASKDPRVRAEAAAFGEDISAQFFSGGKSFTGPVIESLAILRDAFHDMDLGSSWERVAPFVTKVAEGIAGMGQRFMPGFNRALDAAGPGLDVLGTMLPRIGAALGDMVGDIAQSEGALEGLMFVLKMVESGLRVTGDVITFLSNRFHELVAVGAEVSGVLEDLPIFELQKLFGIDFGRFNDHMEDIRDTSAAAKAGLGGLAEAGHVWSRSMLTQEHAATQLAAAVDRLHQEYSDFFDVQMSQDQANQRVSEGMLRLKEALKENGREWRDNTEAGLANRAALSGQVDALIRQREANIAAGMSASEATAQFAAQLDALSRLARAAGITKEALQDLVGDYQVTVNVTTTGDAAYRAAISRALSGNTGRISGFAAGGEPPIGEPFWVGEGGRPELMVLTPRPRVFSHQESKTMVAAGGAGAAQTAQALAGIAQTLELLTRRPPPVVNLYAVPVQTAQELTATVARELAWSS